MDKPEDGEEDKRGSSIGKNVETAGNTEYPAVFFDSLLDGLLNDQFANLLRCLPRILDNDIEDGKYLIGFCLQLFRNDRERFVLCAFFLD